MGRILHDDWSVRLGENGPGRVLKHLAATLGLARLGNIVAQRLKIDHVAQMYSSLATVLHHKCRMSNVA